MQQGSSAWAPLSETLLPTPSVPGGCDRVLFVMVAAISQARTGRPEAQLSMQGYMFVRSELAFEMEGRLVKD